MSQYLHSFCFKSEVKGPKMLVLGAVHGNEPCGTMASVRLIDDLTKGRIFLKCGQITLIPVCNPQASKQNVRQIDENLNRIIAPYPHPQSYEQHLANELDQAIFSTDVLIDLHSTFSQTARPFIFSDYPDPLADRLTVATGVRYILKGWPEVYAQTENAVDLSTGACAHKYGKTALTVECGNHTDPKAVQTGYDILVRSMQTLGLIDGPDITPTTQEYVHMDTLIFKSKEGNFVRDFAHLDPLKKGETIALFDDGTSFCAPSDGYILLPKSYASIGAEWFYLGHLKPAPNL